MKYLTATQILLIHSMLVDQYGGAHGIRDNALLLSAEQLVQQRAFGNDLYPDAHTKAAVYARNIITSHPFLDGNKRTGITCAAIFLESNGYVLAVKEGELEDYAVSIATDKLSVEDIATWLKTRSRETT